MDKILNCFYLGIVIANNDPDNMGRCKIFIPHMSLSLNDVFKTNIDANYKFPDSINNPDLVKILPDLKAKLPWANYAAPLFGGSASGRYNATKQSGTTSDSNIWIDDKLESGGRPLQRFTGDNKWVDAFSSSNVNQNKYTNQYSNQYLPSDYSNLARGYFTIPNVGAHVWVWFQNGDINYPVYFAASHGQDDIKRIYSNNRDTSDSTLLDYPNSYENKANEKLNDDSKTFRAKTVLNSNKHTLEFIDTDNREVLKMTSFSGSFIEFNNYVTTQLSSNNDQKMVIGDQFLTVRKNQSNYIEQDQDNIIIGNRYLNIGKKVDNTIIQEIISELKNIHEYKRLFDMQRASIEAPGEVSKYQTRKGYSGISNGIKYNNGFIQCPICRAQNYKPITWQRTAQLLNWDGSYQKGSGTVTPIPETKKRSDSHSGQLGYFAALRCDVCNSITYDGTTYGGKNYTYQYPKQLGYNPSSSKGLWVPEPLKSKSSLNPKIIESNNKLINLQSQLGIGGNKITNISKNKIETIGLAFNDLKSYRIDPIGKLRIAGVYVAPEESYETYKPSPYIEAVNVADYPGGDYNLTVGNKFRVIVGSKGISMKTTGPLDIHGTISTITGEQLNIGTRNEVNIDGGERFNLRARRISFTPYEHNPVTIEGQLHVTRNTVIKGGTMSEGEVGLLHVTAPSQWYETERPVIYSGGVGNGCSDSNTLGVPSLDQTMWDCPSLLVGFELGGDGSVIYTGHEDSVIPTIIKQPPHSHYFKGIAAELMPTQQDVRLKMNSIGINSTQVTVSASPLVGLGVAGPSDPVALLQSTSLLLATLYASSPDLSFLLLGTVLPTGAPPTIYAISPYNETTKQGQIKYTYVYNCPFKLAPKIGLPVSVSITYTYDPVDNTDGKGRIEQFATVNGQCTRITL